MANTNLIKGLTSITSNLNSTIDGINKAIHDSFVNFAAERLISDGITLPEDKIIAYENKLSDSHNAFNIGTGIFTTPLDGTYVFEFFGHFICREYVKYLYSMKNQAKIEIFHCDTGDGILGSGSTIFFSMQLKSGDQVGVNSGNSGIGHYVRFIGLMLPRY